MSLCFRENRTLIILIYNQGHTLLVSDGENCSHPDSKTQIPLHSP